MLLKLISVFVGGGIVAILRYSLTLLASKYFVTPMLGTFSANIIGCLLIGCFFGFILYKAEAVSPVLKLFITTGLLGGLTTFSTLNFEVFELIKAGKILIGFGYLFLSCLIGLICVYLGYLFFSKI